MNAFPLPTKSPNRFRIPDLEETDKQSKISDLHVNEREKTEKSIDDGLAYFLGDMLKLLDNEEFFPDVEFVLDGNLVASSL